MIRRNHFFQVFLAVVLLTGCQKQTPFLGDLSVVDDPLRADMVVKADSVVVSEHMLSLAVHDTLAILFTPRMDGHFFTVYNTETSELIGRFFPRGNGHDEFIAVSPVEQIVADGERLTALLYAPNEEKMIVWDILESIRQQQTVYTSIPYASRQKDSDMSGFSRLCLVGKDSILTYRSCQRYCVNDETRFTRARWEIRTFSTNALINSIYVFEQVEDRENTLIVPENFYASYSSISPDRSKLVEALCFLPQINIVDVKSGKLTGTLLKGHDDYSVFETDMQGMHCYYAGVECTDDYIFALWSGQKQQSPDFSRMCDEVHVFDWKGHPVKKVRLSVPVESISIDPVKGLLYGTCQDCASLYRYKVADMGL